MAGPSGKKTAKVKVEEMINPIALRHNVTNLNFLQNFVAIVLGIVVGIMGITGWHGFIFHYAGQFACAAAMFTKGCTNPSSYFHTWYNLLFSGTLSSTTLLSYILFWMIFYNISHVF